METKKYIIEIPDNTAWLQWVKVSDKDGHVCFDFKDPEDLTLYTEPDLDAVRKEAYGKGYQDATVKIGSDEQAIAEKAYRKGLKDAWEAARKIAKLNTDEQKRLFGCFGIYFVAHEFSAHEAIEKIRQYEQEQKEKQHTWIFSEVNEPSVDTTLICSKCGYTITIKPGDTQALNFCPKCGDNKNPKEEEA